ncbi:acyl-CoA thioesterase [Pseudonocardia sp. GCM10023141]|uniref:acyl-CoA thioesterase n=1 Tax=Pseudonocardia sp. GCM10023141 TaxID=3252653 RepID=UPI0036085D36
MTRGFLPLMQLDEAGPASWRGPLGDDAGDRIPHGLLVAQAVVAAGRTVDTDWRWVHAVHATYLTDGDPAPAPVEYRVDRLQDTDHTATRLVRAVQGDRALATVTVAFQAPRRGVGPTHQLDGMGEPPDPHSLPARDVAVGVPIDVRYLDRAPWEPAPGPEAANRMWVRVTEEIPDQVLLHAAAIVFVADLLLVEPVAPPLTGEWTDLDTGRGLHAVALDLSVRFHRGFRADDWVLHEHRSPSIAGYRAYSTGQFYSSMGRLVASVSQETALLPVAAPGAVTRPVGSSHNGSRGR